MSAMQGEGREAAREEGAGFRRFARAELASALGLAVLWLIPALVVGFSGEIPLNDDYAYAWVVRALFEEGSFERLPVTWVPILTSTYWGALFAWPAGFSFAALRLSSWVAGGIGIWATHRLMRETGADRRSAFVVAAMLAVNPIYVDLAFTFMTDIPFIALTTMSLAAFARNLRSGGLASLALATALAVAATLTRQVGLALPIAFAFAVIIGTRQPGRVARAAIVAAVVLGSYFLFVVAEPSGRAEVYGVADLSRQFGRSAAIWHGAQHLLEGLVVLGAFLSPLLLATRAPQRWWLWFAASVALVFSGIHFFGLAPMPWDNIIRATGLGVHGLRGGEGLPQVALALRWGATFLASGCAGVVAGSGIEWLLKSPQERLRNPHLWLFLIFSGASMAPYITRSPFFDRYVVVIVPAAAALVLVAARGMPGAEEDTAWAGSRWKRGLAALLLVVSGWFATAGTYGSLELARTQAAVLAQLEADGVPVALIDGGRAWNAWRYDWVNMPRLSGEKRSFVYDDVWVLSFEAEIEGYEPVSAASYARGLAPTAGQLYLHRRVEPPPPPERRSRAPAGG